METCAQSHGLIGRGPQIESVRQLIEKAARNHLPVLLTGESGTGKEVVARAIHSTNPRGQFVTVDCGSLVGTLMESELFGHVKGAFTSATEHKKGLVEMADSGTIFFDEIGDLPLEMQVKLLRLIQEGEFRAVGSTTWRKADLRIIAATHRELRAEVAAGRFRLDLFYRLNVFSIRLPSLRDRKEDIPGLVQHFLAATPEFELYNPLLEIMASYNWPGNVRELQHCIQRLAALSSKGAQQINDLPSPFQDYIVNANLRRLSYAVAPVESVQPDMNAAVSAPPVLTIQESERRAIATALDAANGQRGRAAELLKMSRTTLYRRMKQYKMV